MTSQSADMTSCQFFWRCFVPIVEFTYWPKFLGNIITGSGVLTIFFYNELTTNSKIGNTPVELCPISTDWGKLGIPNLARMSLIRFYWMQQKARVTAFTVTELLREDQQGGGGGGGERFFTIKKPFINHSIDLFEKNCRYFVRVLMALWTIATNFLNLQKNCHFAFPFQQAFKNCKHLPIPLEMFNTENLSNFQATSSSCTEKGIKISQTL